MVSIWGERIAALLGAAFALYMMSLAWGFPAGGHLFPVFACGAMLVVSVLMIVRTFISPEVFQRPFEPRISAEAVIPIVATIATVLYILIIFHLGYYTSTLIYLVVFSLAVGVRNIRSIVLTALVALPLMYVFFEVFLQARMPKGWLI
ncbi:tripartite tricarboxylate transporter TctB family protein [Pelagibacterium montanilacus]|uniref:tripartite tricarboxylate transporter TctB family protein n=1 Tax=Pelagibacterium montanilacus TaxID=2185280 RepID=UPI0013E0E1D7|nr:tripartite tricarboxylate transporter TctB family protein [Pelagibacterium montanilacus]